MYTSSTRFFVLIDTYFTGHRLDLRSIRRCATTAADGSSPRQVRQRHDKHARHKPNMHAKMRLATSDGTNERRPPDTLFECVGVKGCKHASHTGTG